MVHARELAARFEAYADWRRRLSSGVSALHDWLADQDAVESVSGESFAREAGRIWDDQDRMANEEFAKTGMKISTASPAMNKELHERLKNIDEIWIKEANAKGVDGRAALEMFRREVANYKRP